MVASGSRQLGYVGVLVALALAGCGSGHTSGGGGNAYASLAWGIYDIEDPNYTLPLACAEVGATTVVVTLVDATGTAYPQTAVNCVDGQMSTAYVPAGSYTIGFDLYGDPAVYGNSTTLLDSFDATGTFHLLAGANDFRSQFAPFIVQSFMVSWSVYYQNALSSCAAVGAAAVDLDFAVTGSTTWISRSFDCATGQGASLAIPYGTATTAQWKLFLVNSAGQDLQTINGGSVTLPTTTNVYLGTQLFSL